MLLSFPRIALQCKAPVALPLVAGPVLTRARSGATMPWPFHKSTAALSHRNRSALMKFAASVRKTFAPRALWTAAVLLALSLSTSPAATTPGVGDAAPNFILNTLEDKPVELKQLTAKRPVVLVV